MKQCNYSAVALRKGLKPFVAGVHNIRL